jgi:hypothetical protein
MMENTKIKNTKTAIHNFTDFEELTDFIEGNYYNMLENTNKLDDIFWNIEKEGLSANVTSSLEQLINLMDTEFKMVFNIEDLIYREIKLVLPEQSSASAFKSENETILNLLETIKSIIGDKEDLKQHKDLLQAEIIAAAGLIQRNIHKKGSIMFHEARTLIPEDHLAEIVHAVNVKNILTT